MKTTDDIRAEFVETAGHLTQSLGVGRVLGQIFAHTFFSRDPQTLDSLVASLQISKGSASMAVRQLEQWGALRRVWVRGDRKAYYEASTELGRILRKALVDFIGRNMEISDTLLESAETSLGTKKNGSAQEDVVFMRGRVDEVRVFRDRIQRLWNNSIVTMLLKK